MMSFHFCLFIPVVERHYFIDVSAQNTKELGRVYPDFYDKCMEKLI